MGVVAIVALAAADKACIPLYGDCTHDMLGCCYHTNTTTCYKKDEWYSQCLDTCGHDTSTKGWDCSHPTPGPEPSNFECHHYITGIPICLPGNGTNSSSLQTCETVSERTATRAKPCPVAIRHKRAVRPL